MSANLSTIDAINSRLLKAAAIADLMGNLDPGRGSLNDDTENNASWAIKDLLAEAQEHLGTLQDAMRCTSESEVQQ